MGESWWVSSHGHFFLLSLKYRVGPFYVSNECMHREDHRQEVDSLSSPFWEMLILQCQEPALQWLFLLLDALDHAWDSSVNRRVLIMGTMNLLSNGHSAGDEGRGLDLHRKTRWPQRGWGGSCCQLSTNSCH